MTRAVVLSLLSDIKARPEQDGLRLILADYLEDHGDDADRARAELIRAQVGAGAASASSQALCRRLQERFGQRWLGQVAPWLKGWSPRRGLVTAQVPFQSLHSQGLRAHADSEAWAWVDSVELLGGHGPPRGLAASGLLSNLNAVKFTFPWVYGREVVNQLAGANWLRPIRHLDLSRLGLDGANLVPLLVSPLLQSLESLDLSGNALATAALPGLGRAVRERGLRSLVLRDCRLSGHSVRALVEGEGLAGLKELDLRDNRIDDVGALVLASAPLGGLESLSLWGNPIGGLGWPRLRERFGARVHGAP